MNKPSEPELLPISAAVLMGGRSERFGSSKAFLPYKGESLAAHQLSLCSTFSSDVFAVAREPSQVPPDAKAFPLVTDQWEERGPLSGLQAALSEAEHPALFLCGVDMPFLTREVAEGLWWAWEEEKPDVVVPRIGGHWEPLCALWARTALRVLVPSRWKSFQQLLSEGFLRIRTVTEEELRTWDPSLDCLRNFNTREDWEEALSDQPQDSRR